MLGPDCYLRTQSVVEILSRHNGRKTNKECELCGNEFEVLVMCCRGVQLIVVIELTIILLELQKCV